MVMDLRVSDETAVNTITLSEETMLGKITDLAAMCLQVHNVVSYPGFSSGSAFFWVSLGNHLQLGGVGRRCPLRLRLYKESCEDGWSCVAQRATFGGKTPFPSMRCGLRCRFPKIGWFIREHLVKF